MIDELRALAIFAKTVEMGSFRGSAQVFNLSPSVVSHHISNLETHLGVTLLYRSTRQLSLTEEGAKLFEAAKAMLEAAENGFNTITHKSSEPSGKLNITIPAFFTRSELTKAIATFAQMYPKIILAINFSDVKQHLIREGIDLAIRIGSLKDSTLKAKKLFDMKRTLVVAPAYINNNKKPKKPEDLIAWDWIGLKMRSYYKILINNVGKTFKIEFNPRIIVDSIDAVCQLSIAGLGLATPPSFLIEKDIQEGNLIEPLPEWGVNSLSVYAVWPPNASKESLTYRLIDFLANHLNNKQ